MGFIPPAKKKVVVTVEFTVEDQDMLNAMHNVAGALGLPTPGMSYANSTLFNQYAPRIIFARTE